MHFSWRMYDAAYYLHFCLIYKLSTAISTQSFVGNLPFFNITYWTKSIISVDWQIVLSKKTRDVWALSWDVIFESLIRSNFRVFNQNWYSRSLYGLQLKSAKRTWVWVGHKNWGWSPLHLIMKWPFSSLQWKEIFAVFEEYQSASLCAIGEKTVEFA